MKYRSASPFYDLLEKSNIMSLPVSLEWLTDSRPKYGSQNFDTWNELNHYHHLNEYNRSEVYLDPYYIAHWPMYDTKKLACAPSSETDYMFLEGHDSTHSQQQFAVTDLRFQTESYKLDWQFDPHYMELSRQEVCDKTATFNHLCNEFEILSPSGEADHLPVTVNRSISLNSVIEHSQGASGKSSTHATVENSLPDGSINYPIVRYDGKSIRASRVKSSVQIGKRIDLSFTSTFESVTSSPWSARERSEGRRLVRVLKSQEKNVLSIDLVILSLDVGEGSHKFDMLDCHVDISCLKYNHENSGFAEFFITSLDVIRIVEYFIGTAGKNYSVRRRERARIRSNLGPLWHRYYRYLESNQMRGTLQMFFERIQACEISKPVKVSKSIRLLLWANLNHALYKALDFYRVMVPESKS